MKILVDADSCSKLKLIESVGLKHNIEIHLFFDTTHNIESETSIIHIVDKGKDSADFSIINNVEKGDIIITNDTGLAMMALSKEAFILKRSGQEITDKNIYEFYNYRYFKSRMKKNVRIKSMLSKSKQIYSLKESLERIIKENKENNENAINERNTNNAEKQSEE